MLVIEYFVYSTLFILALIVLAFETRRMIRRKRKRFECRSLLDADELRQLFGNRTLPDTVVDKFLMAIERATDVPRGKLRTGDRIAIELAPEPGWEFDDGTAILPIALQRCFGGDARDYDFDQTTTLLEVLNRLAGDSDAGR